MAANQHPIPSSHTPTANLVGTPKQIAWAMSIRQHIVEELDCYIQSNTHELIFDEFSVISFAAIKQLIVTKQSAAFFIDHRNFSTLDISRIVCLEYLKLCEIASEERDADLNSEISLLKSRVEKLHSLVLARLPAITEKSRRVERFYDATHVENDEKLPASYSHHRRYVVDNILDIVCEIERQLDTAARKLSKL